VGIDWLEVSRRIIAVIHGPGRVCVAIDAKNADKFDPFKVPTISQLLREYEQVRLYAAKQ
jgi:hypothetical protein